MTNPATPKMTDIVFCSRCGGREFYGHLTWSRESTPVCRACIHREWQAQDPKWSAAKEKVFPDYIATQRMYKTKEQQIASLQAAINLINAATPEEQNPRDKQDRAPMLRSAAELIQDALEWLEDLDA